MKWNSSREKQKRGDFLLGVIASFIFKKIKYVIVLWYYRLTLLSLVVEVVDERNLKNETKVATQRFWNTS